MAVVTRFQRNLPQIFNARVGRTVKVLMVVDQRSRSRRYQICVTKPLLGPFHPHRTLSDNSSNWFGCAVDGVQFWAK